MNSYATAARSRMFGSHMESNSLSEPDRFYRRLFSSNYAARVTREVISMAEDRARTTHVITFLALIATGLLFQGGIVWAQDVSKDIVGAARQQVGVTTTYDPSYIGIAFPNGDLSEERGVCTDVIIRALRISHNVDLQERVNADMNKAFNQYPKIWGHSVTDRNIDHRRVPNLQVYLARIGAELPAPSNSTEFNAGDIITSILPGNLPHIGIVSDTRGESGNLMIIHNIGSGTKEEDRLFDFPMSGHYRPSRARW